MMNSGTILTGIKPTGSPHLGNYFGAIKPAIDRVLGYEKSFLFIADYHALNTVQNPQDIKNLTQKVAAAWLACGLDLEKTHFYRQSDVPQIFELSVILNAFTPKGWMNKMHAYKAKVDKNRLKQKPDDFDVNMGLYNYPILMAADILIAQTNFVPVGKDQIQHVEITRDIAQKINSHFQKEIFTLPEYIVEKEMLELPGIDGKKMSKSYGNVIPLFEDENVVKKAINKIVTDNKIHDFDSIKETIIYQIFLGVAGEYEALNMAREVVEKGVGWGSVKNRLFEVYLEKFQDKKKIYDDVLKDIGYLENILNVGGAKMRLEADEFLNEVKKNIGYK